MYEVHDDNLISQLIHTERLPLENIDRPHLLDVLRQWEEARGDKFAPTRQQFRLEDLPSRVLPNTVLVRIDTDPFDYLYMFFGTNMAAMSGVELTGKRYYADAIKGYGFVNARWFPVMVEERTPIHTITDWIAVSGLQRQTETVRLPLSDDGATVTHGLTVNHLTTPM